jgi:hypothetical protein
VSPRRRLYLDDVFAVVHGSTTTAGPQSLLGPAGRRVMVGPQAASASSASSAAPRQPARAWSATTSYLATCAADARHGVNAALFADGIHLSTSLPGPGKVGFAYLGGNLLYPWHGTGYVDASGKLGAAFALLLGASSLVPVYRAGSAQPLLWIPPELTIRRGDDRLVAVDSVRLRSR